MRQLRFLAYVSFVYGGFLLFAYLGLVYSAVWRSEFPPIFPATLREAGEANASAAVSALARHRGPPIVDPIAVVFSPLALVALLTALIFLLNGYYLFKFLRAKENKETKKFIVSSLLTPEEKIFFDELARSGGQATQKQLSLNSGFSAVKTFRVLKRLESKSVIKTYPFGMTKKVVLIEK